MLKYKMTIMLSAWLFVSCGTAEQLDELASEDQDSSEFTELLNEFGLTDDGVDIEAEETDDSELSEDAAAVMAQVKAIKDEIKAELDQICERDEELRDSIRTQLTEIFDDESLSEDEKIEAAKAVKEANIDLIKAAKEEMQACIAENEGEWSAGKESFEPVNTACLPERSQWNRGKRQNGDQGPKRQRGAQASLREGGRPELTEEFKAELESLLTSEECQSAIDSFGDEAADEEGDDAPEIID